MNGSSHGCHEKRNKTIETEVNRFPVSEDAAVDYRIFPICVDLQLQLVFSDVPSAPPDEGILKPFIHLALHVKGQRVYRSG